MTQEVPKFSPSKKSWEKVKMASAILMLVIVVAIAAPPINKFLHERNEKLRKIERLENVIDFANTLLLKSEELYSYANKCKQSYDKTALQNIFDDLLKDDIKRKKILKYLSLEEKVVDYYLKKNAVANPYDSPLFKSSDKDLARAWVDYMTFNDSRDYMNENSYKGFYESFEKLYQECSGEDAEYRLLASLGFCTFYFYDSNFGKEWGTLHCSHLYFNEYSLKKKKAEEEISKLKKILCDLKK